MSPYLAAPTRYEQTSYTRTGRSGLMLPRISLGLWHNFGDVDALDTQRAILRRAFDCGITHFDLANNYGPPPGSAETNFGRIFSEDFHTYRDELILSTKAGYRMGPGPYGEWGSRKSLLSSLDQSLKRMRVDYVDIFYSHRPDLDTPLEETMSALDQAVRSGRALYAGISNYSPERTTEAARILRDLGTPCLIHQPSYNIFNRHIERGLTEVLTSEGIGSIVFSPLAQGQLTSRYLLDIPADSRAAKAHGFLKTPTVHENQPRIQALNKIADARGQSLAQMAISWVLRLPEVTSALIGASSVSQLNENLSALENLTFSEAELAEIDTIAPA